MAGSDRVPDPNDSKRAQVGNAQTDYESEMALFYECMLLCAQKCLTQADIVRDGMLQQLLVNECFPSGSNEQEQASKQCGVAHRVDEDHHHLNFKS